MDWINLTYKDISFTDSAGPRVEVELYFVFYSQTLDAFIRKVLHFFF